jgi:hypothetical protein
MLSSAWGLGFALNYGIQGPVLHAHAFLRKNLLEDSEMKQVKRTIVLGMFALAALAPGHASAATPCDLPGTVGGGAIGLLSPGPVGPPNSLGWDVGSGQCNGSFSITSEPGFPGGAIELGLRAEQRRIGQVAPSGPNDYTVQTGPDVGPAVALNRAWWNFQGAIAYGGAIADLDALTLEITTDVGPNLPANPLVDLLAIRAIIDDRNNQPNATTGFADLYQVSQNPEFGWFAPASDTDANPTGAFDYDAPGAWRFKLTAVEGSSRASVTVCIHTPGQVCALAPNAAKQKVRDDLAALLPTGNSGDDKRIDKAIERLDKSLRSDRWIDDDLLAAKDGKKVFDEEAKAADELLKVRGTVVLPFVLTLVDVDAQLATGAIADAQAAYGNAGCASTMSKECKKAEKELAKAADELVDAAAAFSNVDYVKAINEYRKAWFRANKALKALS